MVALSILQTSLRVDTETADGPTSSASRAISVALWVERIADWFGWAIAGLATLAICLRGIGTPALWRDEMATWWASTVPWDDFIRLIGRVDAVMAPYYVFMRGWIAVVGDSATAMHLPSALAMAGTAAVLVCLGRKLFGPWIGLFAGMLMAIMPCTTRYGQEARGYALSLLACAVATHALVLALENPRWVR